MSDTPRRLKVCLVCSHGGHLTEMLELAPAFEDCDTFYFSYDADTTRRLPKTYLVPNMGRNIGELAKNLFRVWTMFSKECPDAVVSTGAEIALPVIAVARLRRVPMLYIECGAQVVTPSFTGRFMYWLADLFLVQWRELAEVYGPRAHFRGSLVDEAGALPPGEKPR
jgi:UDP-N-acetylglucosamine:LPS N-acetylglucosamine transferase